MEMQTKARIVYCAVLMMAYLYWMCWPIATAAGAGNLDRGVLLKVDGLTAATVQDIGSVQLLLSPMGTPDGCGRPTSSCGDLQRPAREHVGGHGCNSCFVDGMRCEAGGGCSDSVDGQSKVELMQ